MAIGSVKRLDIDCSYLNDIFHDENVIEEEAWLWYNDKIFLVNICVFILCCFGLLWLIKVCTCEAKKMIYRQSFGRSQNTSLKSHNDRV
ncbi:Oidioi.mRNA.OKI2018_I69.chr2.g6735.t1.cds [Oikopleura dioica]|uniref:Oidioi.mRNA.OKI2018_I69.chr2.g6735.t1.cds n=1 Tax=Oikopleura dioica TaxID=34765 RepID=A0ABN7T6A1_OIKDI|nr:Oidioi.mRNA.OKI2018_I69.chr2.g6735.t1.cds [Oikopleura dioica]